MLVHDLVMVADIMTTQLHILYVDVVVIVVDVMTTQDVYSFWPNVTANCAWCNYYMSACILALLLTHEVECYHIYVVYVWLLWTGFIIVRLHMKKYNVRFVVVFYHGNMTTGFYNVSQ